MAEIFYLSLIGALLFFGPALAAIAIRRSLSIIWQFVLLGVCILYGISPLLVAWGGLSLAERFGCKAEIVIYKCPENPSLGDWVTAMTFAHWGAIVTIPSGILGIIGLLISLVLKVSRLRTGETVERSADAFYRSRRNKIIAGLCAAIAQRWGLSLLGIRIATVVLAIVTPGFGVPLYLCLWLAFPPEPSVKST